MASDNELFEFDGSDQRYFPNVVDRNGVPLGIGKMVLPLVGEFAGKMHLGEVTRWAGRRGVEVIFTEPPELLAFHPSDLEVWDIPRQHPITKPE